MLNTDSVRTRFIDERQARRITDQWNAVYSEMRAILDSVIKAWRQAGRPAADIAKLEVVRRGLGQLDRGTFKGCTRSPGAFSVFYALRHVHRVLNVAWLDHPAKGAIYRLAGELADVNVATNEAFAADQAAQREMVVPAQRVDRSRGDRADSNQTERGTTR